MVLFRFIFGLNKTRIRQRYESDKTVIQTEIDTRLSLCLGKPGQVGILGYFEVSRYKNQT